MKTRHFLSIILLSLFLFSMTACITIQVGEKKAEESAAPTLAPTAVVVTQPTAVVVNQPTAAPSKPTLTLSNEVYTATPAGFAFNVPQGWNQIVNVPLFAAYQSPDLTGALFVRAYHTGTEFGVEAFNQAVQNGLNVVYSDVNDLVELERQESEGLMMQRRSTFTNAQGVKYISMDIFDRRGDVMYIVLFSAHADKWDTYAPAFQQLAATIQINPGVITPEYMYLSQPVMPGPDNLFYLSYPEDWTYLPDDGSLGDNVAISGFVSPDKNGGMFVVRKLYPLKPNNNERASDGLALLKAAVSKDIRVAYDKVLKDGRERLDWWSDANKISGIAWLDTRGKYLVMLIVVWSDAAEATYKPFMEKIAATYTYE